MWQDLAALGLVALAVAYLGRMAWPWGTRKTAGGCASGGCGGCPSARPGARNGPPGPVVQIGSIPPAPRPPR